MFKNWLDLEELKCADILDTYRRLVGDDRRASMGLTGKVVNTLLDAAAEQAWSWHIFGWLLVLGKSWKGSVVGSNELSWCR